MRRVAAIAVMLLGAPALAAPRAVRFDTAADGCPSSEALREALRVTLPESDRPDSLDALLVGVDDKGAALVVTTDEGERRFEDPERDCGERARKAQQLGFTIERPLTPTPSSTYTHVRCEVVPSSVKSPRCVSGSP